MYDLLLPKIAHFLLLPKFCNFFETKLASSKNAWADKDLDFFNFSVVS